MLKPKTRGVNLPQGKPRVYFAAHPLDREAYFEELAGDILAVVNCAVWYNDSADEQTSLDDLREMKLFVVPVTTRLFESANDARDREVPFALANNIPLLPILCERSAADRFNKTFGTKHCLDRVSDDPNALPYETKLEEFLKSALLRDRQLDEILAAFSARLFLSYRKKRHGESYPLSRYANLQLTESVDHFVGSFVTRVRIQSNSGSSGGGGGGGFSGGSRGRR